MKAMEKTRNMVYRVSLSVYYVIFYRPLEILSHNYEKKGLSYPTIPI